MWAVSTHCCLLSWPHNVHVYLSMTPICSEDIPRWFYDHSLKNLYGIFSIKQEKCKLNGLNCLIFYDFIFRETVPLIDFLFQRAPPSSQTSGDHQFPVAEVDAHSPLFQPKPSLLLPLRLRSHLVRLRRVRWRIVEVRGRDHSLLVRPLYRKVS